MPTPVREFAIDCWDGTCENELSKLGKGLRGHQVLGGQIAAPSIDDLLAHHFNRHANAAFGNVGLEFRSLRRIHRRHTLGLRVQAECRDRNHTHEFQLAA